MSMDRSKSLFEIKIGIPISLVPSIATNLSSGLDLFPPKFVRLWMSLMFPVIGSMEMKILLMSSRKLMNLGSSCTDGFVAWVKALTLRCASSFDRLETK